MEKNQILINHLQQDLPSNKNEPTFQLYTHLHLFIYIKKLHQLHFYFKVRIIFFKAQIKRKFLK